MAPKGAVLGTLTLFYRDCVRPSEMEEGSALILASLAGLIIGHINLQAAPARRQLRCQPSRSTFIALRDRLFFDFTDVIIKW